MQYYNECEVNEILFTNDKSAMHARLVKKLRVMTESDRILGRWYVKQVRETRYIDLTRTQPSYSCSHSHPTAICST